MNVDLAARRRGRRLAQRRGHAPACRRTTGPRAGNRLRERRPAELESPALAQRRRGRREGPRGRRHRRRSPAAPSIADVDVRLHDPADAELQLQTAQGDAKDPTIAAMTHFMHGRLADRSRRRGQRRRRDGGVRRRLRRSRSCRATSPATICWIAPAEEAAGHADKADAALEGRRPLSSTATASAATSSTTAATGRAPRRPTPRPSVASRPDLPAGFYAWGVALARHGDLAGAEAKLAAAHARGPNWADPLKAWGDVLARQGRWREALAKYDEALKQAPNWAELQRARDAASRHKELTSRRAALHP